MPALSSRHGTAFRLLRIGALLVACLVFLYGCEVSRSATLGDVPQYLIAAALAAVVAFTAAWFEIRAVRAAHRGVVLSEGRWLVVGRTNSRGELLILGHDDHPDADPGEIAAGWTWTFAPGALDAVRETVAAACFPGADPDDLRDLDLLDLLADAVPLLDRAARADPGAWLHAHGIAAERAEWGADPAVTTRTLPVVHLPRRGKKRAAPVLAGERAAEARARRAAAAGTTAPPPARAGDDAPKPRRSRRANPEPEPGSPPRREAGQTRNAETPGSPPRGEARRVRTTETPRGPTRRANRHARSTETPGGAARQARATDERGGPPRHGGETAAEEPDGPTTPTHRPAPAASRKPPGDTATGTDRRRAHRDRVIDGPTRRIHPRPELPAPERRHRRLESPSPAREYDPAAPVTPPPRRNPATPRLTPPRRERG